MPGSGPASISGSPTSPAARSASRLPTGRSTTTSDTTSTFGARRGDQGHALVASTMPAAQLGAAVLRRGTVPVVFAAGARTLVGPEGRIRPQAAEWRRFPLMLRALL